MTTSPKSQCQLNLLLTKSISPQWTQLKIDHCLLHNDFLIMVIFLFSSWGKKNPKANSLICFIFKISQHTPCLWISKCLNVPHPWAMPKNQRNLWKEVLSAMGLRSPRSHSLEPDLAVNTCSDISLHSHALTNPTLKIKGDSLQVAFIPVLFCSGTWNGVTYRVERRLRELC